MMDFCLPLNEYIWPKFYLIFMHFGNFSDMALFNPWDHPFKTSANFTNFWPLPPYRFLVLSVGKFVQFLTPPPLWHADVLNGWSPCIKIKKIWGQMYSFEVVDNRPLYIFHKVLLAPSKCLSKGIKVDKLDYLKSHPRDFKNSFYFGIV